MSDRFAIIIGNEGNGMCEDFNNICEDFINIPINKSCESLNAAIASAIIMYEINKDNYE